MPVIDTSIKKVQNGIAIEDQLSKEMIMFELFNLRNRQPFKVFKQMFV